MSATTVSATATLVASHKLDKIHNDLCRLVLEKQHQQNMPAHKHIAIETWLEALGMLEYLPCFGEYNGVEELLYLSETEVRELGLKSPPHRAKIISSLRILREKYERSTLPGRKALLSAQLQRSHSATAQLSWSPPSAVDHPDYQMINIPPEKLQADLIKELNGDPADLRSRSWYHGKISRQRAERLVPKNGDFLVRDCISQPGDFVLTCCWRGVPLHFVINSKVTDMGHTTLPKVTYHFEDEDYGSVQTLIHCYMESCRAVTQTSGAVLTNPVGRSMPLSYYDTKYGALSSQSVGVNHYSSPTQSPKRSPYGTPTGSPSGSPKAQRTRKVERSGSQPLLSLEDETGRSSSPTIDRCDSLPSMGTGIYKQITPVQPNRTQPPACVHQRSGSEPVMMGVDEYNRPPHSHSLLEPPKTLTPASSDSYLDKPPPPKPSRIPSVKYKKRPQVEVRKPELYRDDDRDYSDYGQVKSDPSWLHSGIPSIHQGQVASHFGENLYDNNMNKKVTYEHSQDEDRVHEENKFRKSSDTRFSILDTRDYADIPKFPVDSINRTESLRIPENTNLAKTNSKSKEIIIPRIETEMSFDYEKFQSVHLQEENRLLDPSVLLNVRTMLLESSAKTLAQHLTRVDLDVLKVMNEDDLGVFVQSGLELLTLPQGKQLRQDILERTYCIKAFAMIMILTCPKVTERAHMVSQWIQVATELRSHMGNLFGFENVMEALMSNQIQRLGDTWLILRQNHTSSAFVFDTKLKSVFRSLNTGSGSLPIDDVSIPNITPLVHLLERSSETLMDYLPWEINDINAGLDFLLVHLDTTRIITAQSGIYKVSGQVALKDFKLDEKLLEIFKTEFHLRFLWGFKGAGVERTERQMKFNQLLTAYSEKIERTGDDGTEV